MTGARSLMVNAMFNAGHRLSVGVVTLFGVLVLTFVISNIIPADPAALLAGETAGADQVAELRRRLGLDQPLYVQFWHYLTRLVQGDLGVSLFTARPVTDDLFARLPATTELAVSALVISIIAGVPVGVLSALRRNSMLDHVVRGLTVSGVAIASFWMAIMLQLVFSMELGWLPLSGRMAGAPPPDVTGLLVLDSLLALDAASLVDALAHLALPAAVLAFPVTATIVRFTRAGVLDRLGQPSVQYMQSMGLAPSLIVWKYVLRGALTSVVTQIGLVTGTLLGGSVVIEIIFDWPGIGYYTANSIIMSDYNAVMASTIWIAAIYIGVNMLVDIVHHIIDPRGLTR